MNLRLLPLLLLPSLLLAVHPSTRAASAPTQAPALPRATPESQGVSSAGLLEFIEVADRDLGGIHSVMILRHGRVVTEGWWAPYEPHANHELYSLSKSFTATAVGFAVAEGRLSLDDEVLKFFPDSAPAEPSANLRAMRVRDLLTMSTGHQDETSSAPDKITPASFLAHPVPHKPGTHFRYNTPATFMLSAIVQQRSGQNLLDYLRPRLFEPLGIEHPTWDTNAQGVALGGYGLRVRTEDIARFGQLHLQNGRWNGRQLLPPDWVPLATSRQVSNGSNPNSDWDQGYGFQFWRCRHNAYRGDGAFGQYCLVLPDQDAVIAITSGLKNMQAVLDAVWDRLLPAFHPRRLPRNREAHQRLTTKLAALTLPPPQGASTSTSAPQVFARSFSFPPNDQGIEALTLRPGSNPGDILLSTTTRGATTTVPYGHGAWTRSQGPFGPYPSESLAGAAAWTAEDTLTLLLCARETPYLATLRLRFDGDQVTFDAETNVGFGNTRRPSLVGKAR